MNADDIVAMYPEIKEDFSILSGPEADALVRAAADYNDAAEAEKAAAAAKKDASDAIAVYLKDTKELRVNRDGMIVPIASWTEKKGAEGIIGLKEIRTMTGGATIEKYLSRKGLIREGKGSRYVNVKWRED